jgi:hypothetical protein
MCPAGQRLADINSCYYAAAFITDKTFAAVWMAIHQAVTDVVCVFNFHILWRCERCR